MKTNSKVLLAVGFVLLGCGVSDVLAATSAAVVPPKTIGSYSSGWQTPRISTAVKNIASRYIAAAKYCQSGDSAIKAKAAEITKGSKTDAQKAQKIFDYVNNNYSYKFYHGGSSSAKEMLSKKQGNGVDTAHLFIALCRASGIEARYQRALVADVKGMGINAKQIVRVFAQVKLGGKWVDADPADKRNQKVGKIEVNIVKRLSVLSEYTHRSDTKVTLASRVSTAPVVAAVKKSVSNAVAASPAKFLSATKNAQVNDPAIKALAAKLTAGKTSETAKATAIFNYVRDNLSYSFYYNSRKGAAGALKSRSANCCDTANLVVALSRAAGLEAQYKHATCKFRSGSTYGHVWAQIKVGGKWLNADATSNSNSLNVIKNWSSSSNVKTYRELAF